ncbi:acyl-ACP thioesterase [Dietzia sp. 2505]
MNDPVQDDGLQPLPPPPSAESGYSTSRTVRTGEVDPLRRLRLDSIARYLQDVAGDDLEATGHARTDPYWIVRRTVIDVIEPISWPATVHLQRWCSGLSTRWANMRVRLTAEHRAGPDDDGPRPGGLVETEAFWINVNSHGVPARISDEGFATLSATTETHRLRWAAMTTPPPAGSPGRLCRRTDPTSSAARISTFSNMSTTPPTSTPSRTNSWITRTCWGSATAS